MYRGLGSIGIIGAVRAGLMVATHPTDPNLRVLAVTKTNLARTPPALGFRVVGDDPAHAAIEWTGPLEVSADALGLPTAAALEPRDRASLWLTRELADGPRKVTELLAAAADIGIPEVTLRRAKDAVGARAHQVHFKNGGRAWYWYDACAPGPRTPRSRSPSNCRLWRRWSRYEGGGDAPEFGENTADLSGSSREEVYMSTE